MAPSKLNFKVYQGSTFSETLRWESATKVYVPITNITKTAPMVVITAGHEVPAGWRTRITGVQGMKEANTTDYVLATSVTANTLTYNSVNAINYTAYTAGGVLEYNQPVDLAEYTARMQIREKLSSATVIKELTSDAGDIVLDNSAKTITIKISAADTAQFAFKSAVYSLELVNADVVVPFIYGNLTLEAEVTR